MITPTPSPIPLPSDKTVKDRPSKARTLFDLFTCLSYGAMLVWLSILAIPLSLRGTILEALLLLVPLGLNWLAWLDAARKAGRSLRQLRQLWKGNTDAPNAPTL